MKFIRFFLILVLINIVIIGCDKNDSDESLIGKWEVEKLYDDNLLEPQLDFAYIFEFQDDTSVLVKLDVNSCGGKYNLGCDDCIEFQGFGCTEACCDSEYGEDLIRIAFESTKYDIDDDQLTLEGSGKVVLKKIN